jgi:His/Glu/Gln/Arg/opine family amino acid ABC transporter permease subunit
VFELFNPQVAVANIGPLLGGLLITVELTLVVITLSLVCALVVALAGMSRLAPLRWLVWAYIEVIRGTPLLLQLIYVYYVLPEIGIRLDAFTAGVLPLTLNYST